MSGSAHPERPLPALVIAALLVIAGALATGTGWWIGRSAGEPLVEVDRLTHVHGLEAPAWADGDLYVATHTGLVRRDAGDGRWYEVGDTRHDLMGFRAHPRDHGVMFGSGHPDLRSGLPNPIGVVRSTDAGRTWEGVALVGEVDFHALAVGRADGDVLYGFNVVDPPGLYRSADGGFGWDRVDDAGALLRAGGVTALDIHPADANVLLAGTPAGLLRSDDAGRSWRPHAFDGASVTAVRYGDPDSRTIMAFVARQDVGLTISRDGGRTWHSLGLFLDDGDAVGYVARHPSEADTSYVGTFGLDVLVTRDGGETWRALVERGVPVHP